MNLIEIYCYQDITCLQPNWIFFSVSSCISIHSGTQIVCTLVISSSITGKLVKSFKLIICLNLSLVGSPIITWNLWAKIAFSTFFLVYISKYFRTIWPLKTPQSDLSRLCREYGYRDRCISWTWVWHRQGCVISNLQYCHRWYSTHIFQVVVSRRDFQYHCSLATSKLSVGSLLIR